MPQYEQTRVPLAVNWEADRRVMPQYEQRRPHEEQRRPAGGGRHDNHRSNGNSIHTLACKIGETSESDFRVFFTTQCGGYIDGKFLKNNGTFFAKFESTDAAEDGMEAARRTGFEVQFAKRNME